MKRKLGFIFGTRPEIIKLSPLIKLCRARRWPFFCIHTGQHYSYDMDEIFFRDLELPTPDYKLHIRSKAPFRQGEHTGKMLIDIEHILLKELPYSVVVQGDTNTVLAGALSAEKISTTQSFTGLHIKVAHVEAGLRSYDRNMPEEVNRFITDHLSDYLFAPTVNEKKILLKEGVPSGWIHVTGNTIVDAVRMHHDMAKQKKDMLVDLDLKKGEYILLTLHRQENVDSRKVSADIIRGISLVEREVKLPVIFPMHPRTKKMLERHRLKLPKCIRVIEPVGFFDFLWFEANARLAMTDSGGVQEETCILNVPCVTLRHNTERPETVEVGSNIVAGTEPENILKSARKMLASKCSWRQPFGDGLASKRILEIIAK